MEAGRDGDQKVGPDRPSLRLLPVRMSACVKGVSLASILRLLLAHVVYPGPAGRRGEGEAMKILPSQPTKPLYGGVKL